MNVKLYSYKRGQDQLFKDIDKIEKRMAKISNELLKMTDENSTVRQRSNKRVSLDQLGEERQFKRQYIDELQELIDSKEWKE